MPVNRAWNLARLRQALDTWTLKRHERFIFQYVLLAGVNTPWTTPIAWSTGWKTCACAITST